jgi:hypothetical protein
MNKGLKIALWICLGALAVAGFGLVTMYLWNWLVPDLFNGKVITFWQALGLLVLSKILFSGFGGKRHGGGHHWKQKQRFFDKLSRMTPEEREVFKQRMRDKWCRPVPGDTKQS